MLLAVVFVLVVCCLGVFVLWGCVGLCSVFVVGVVFVGVVVDGCLVQVRWGSVVSLRGAVGSLGAV